MQLAVMTAAERDRELIADFEANALLVAQSAGDVDRSDAFRRPDTVV